tara:strand:- start:1258 stop:1674 length:417 start_codon:yes stop_codon:yes gene_type:complete
MVAKTLNQTNSIVGQHVEPQVNPPMSQITIVNPPENNINMSNLPNNLIMAIIKLADGGLNTHKKLFASTLNSVINHKSMDLQSEGLRWGFDPYYTFWLDKNNYSVDLYNYVDEDNFMDIELIIQNHTESIFNNWALCG